jgi:hypothetical protein
MAWEQLLTNRDLNYEFAREELSRPPLACPNDGTPLEQGPHGELFCRHDGWQWPRDDHRPAA